MDLLGLAVELGKGLVARCLQLVNAGGHLGASRLEPGDVGGQGLGALHHLELDVLERGLPACERLNLVLEGLHVLCRSLARVHPGLVAAAALAYELNVGVGLGDLALDVVQSRLGADPVTVQCGHLNLERAQLGKLGQGRLAVRDLVQSRVQRLQVEQTPLTARVG
jgi:hypothetical protein